MDKVARLKLIVLAILLQFPFFGLLLNAIFQGNDITKLIPAPNSIFDLVYFFIISPLLMIVFIQIFSIILGYIFFKLHNIIKFKRYDYAIYKIENLSLSQREIFIRSLMLGFFSFSIGIVITEFIDSSFIIVDNQDVQFSFFVLISALFVLPFLILFLIPIWVLKDSGIMCSRKKYKEGKLKLPDIEGTYRTYNSYILGYIGVSTIFAVTILIFEDIIFNITGEGEIGFIPLTIITPIAGVGVNMIPLIFYEWQSLKMREKFINKLKEEGIKIVDDIKEL